MVKFSIVYLTYRTGGYDLLADGLVNQTCQDYELICVDEMTQHAKVRESYLRGRGINLYAMVPSKKKCFPDMAYNLINAYNTGVMMSRGDYVIIMNDYTWLPPNALSSWERNEPLLKNNTAISGVGVVVSSPTPADLADPISVWAGDEVNNTLKQVYTRTDVGSCWVPTTFEMFYSAFSYDLLVKTNGFRECYDYASNNQVDPVVQSVKEVGGKLAVDTNCRIYMLDHRTFGHGIDPGMWHLSKKDPEGKETKLIERPNCFDLKTHIRGSLI